MKRRSKKRPAPAAVADLGVRLKSVLESSVAGMERQVAVLSKGKPSTDKTAQLVAIAKDAATVMGHVRRYDEAMRQASRDLSPAIVIAYLRELPAEKRYAIVSEVSDDEEREEGSVLS